MPTQIFPGQFTSLARIGEFVAQSAEEAGLDPSDVYAVKLAVDEACTNIIEHAYEGEGQGDIQCTCKVTEGELSIKLQDWGKPFDPNEVPEPNFDVPLEELKTRGAGLFFMRNLMDEVHFEFDPRKGNVLVMVKKKDPGN